MRRAGADGGALNAGEAWLERLEWSSQTSGHGSLGVLKGSLSSGYGLQWRLREKGERAGGFGTLWPETLLAVDKTIYKEHGISI